MLRESRKAYKPFEYEWANDGFEAQSKMHWIYNEISMRSDLKDFNTKLSEHERDIVSHIMRFFTQTDIEVANGYIDYYLPIFRAPEVRMMLCTFAAMEAQHVAAYDYLFTSLQLSDKLRTEFLEYKEMTEKYDYMRSFNQDDHHSVALTLAIFSGGVEGFVLFSSFAILLYFSARREQRCMTGLGSIVSFSVRDESVHSAYVIKLFHTYVSEHPCINISYLREEIRKGFSKLIEHEFAFIDIALKDGDLEGLTKEDLKSFIRYLANLRLRQLGVEEFRYEKAEMCKSLEWMDQFFYSVEIGNFFEMQVTSYSKNCSDEFQDAFLDLPIDKDD